MDFILVTLGSIGDIVPFFAMGTALRERGHRVVLAANLECGPLAEAFSLEFAPIWDSRSSIHVFDDILALDPQRSWERVWRDVYVPAMKPAWQCIRDRVGNSQPRIVASWSCFGAQLASEVCDLPLYTVYLSPFAMHQAGLTGEAADVRQAHYREAMDELCREVGVPSRPAGPQARDRRLALFPDWFAGDVMAVDRIDCTGFPFFDRPLLPVGLGKLNKFLASGAPPLVVTPGSFMKDAAALFRAAVEACQALQLRAVFLTPFAEQLPANLPDSILHLDYVPLDKVLKRAVALVHHGGIGTTAQALRAGIPQLVTPIFFDQFDNAERLVRLGAARSFPIVELSEEWLLAELRVLLEGKCCRERAGLLCSRLQMSDPMAEFCAVVEAPLSV